MNVLLAIKQCLLDVACCGARAEALCDVRLCWAPGTSLSQCYSLSVLCSPDEDAAVGYTVQDQHLEKDECKDESTLFLPC